MIYILIIYEYKDLVFTTFEIIAPGFENFHNDQKLLIVDYILSFYQDYFFEEKWHKISLSWFWD